MSQSDGDVNPDLEVSNADDFLYNQDLSRAPEVVPASAGRKVKRARGRPRKEPLPSALEPGPEPEPEPEQAAAPAEGGADKADLIRIINDLKKKLNAVGSGLVPSFGHSVEELKAEVDLLNADLNSKRGDQAVKALILYAMPLIELAISRAVPQSQFDVSSRYHLKTEVEENWVIFEEAATHIAILHAKWFQVGPYATIAKATAACAASCNAKNQAVRAKLAAAAPASSAETPIE